MTRDEMLLRFGFYAGLAGRLLGDDSYAKRWYGRAHELTDEDYVREMNEIARRLVVGGLIGADEDPWESQL
jgi:hypothetical protein